MSRSRKVACGDWSWKETAEVHALVEGGRGATGEVVFERISISYQQKTHHSGDFVRHSLFCERVKAVFYYCAQATRGWARLERRDSCARYGNNRDAGKRFANLFLFFYCG